MSKFTGFICAVVCTIVSSITTVSAQEDDNGISEKQLGQSTITVQDESESVTNDELQNTLKPATVENTFNDDNQPGRSGNELLAQGKAKKTAGTVLTSIGGIFMGGWMFYTMLFIADNESFGIYMGSSSSGFMETKFYLNPSIFAVPIGAPCLALGIVNLTKGKKIIRNAMRQNKNDESSVPFKMTPYLSYQPKIKEYGAGFVATF